MGKYAEALGIWEHTIGEITHELIPKKGDNLKISQILTEGKKRNDEAWIIAQLNKFYFDLVLRDYPDLSQEEQGELDNWVEMNQVQIMNDLLLAFRWATEESMKKLQDEAMSPKKLTSVL